MLHFLVALIFCLTISAQAPDGTFTAPIQVVSPTNPVAAPIANTFTAPINANVGSESRPPVQQVNANPAPPNQNLVLLPPTPAVPQDAPTEPIVWLCDEQGVRRGAAGAPESERLIEQGVKLDDCTDRPPRQQQPQPAPAGTGMMCDTNGRPRGRASSPYIASLNRRGVQLQPCPQAAGNGNGNGIGGRSGIVAGGLPGRRGNRIGGATRGNNAGMMCDPTGRPRGRPSSPYIAALTRQGVQLQPCGQGNGNGNANPVPGNRNGMMCDTNGRQRGRASSPYVAALNRRGIQLQPCGQAVNNGNANPVNGNGNGNAIPVNGNGMMCDANGRQRGRASSPYIRALTRGGTQLTPCPQRGAIPVIRPAARATDPGASTATSSSSSSTPAWAISLIVVGSLLIVVLMVLAVRLMQILKA